ncbi:hypothetical protein QR97_16480 [Streptomyces sp. PBH53]|nr:hypothetical protein QR97_16480 [Streptomyces sp. PBH53]
MRSFCFRIGQLATFNKASMQFNGKFHRRRVGPKQWSNKDLAQLHARVLTFCGWYQSLQVESTIGSLDLLGVKVDGTVDPFFVYLCAALDIPAIQYDDCSIVLDATSFSCRIV